MTPWTALTRTAKHRRLTGEKKIRKLWQKGLDTMASAVYSMGMKATRMTLGDGIRRAVNTSGLSRYRICMDTGIDQGAFSRFMHG